MERKWLTSTEVYVLSFIGFITPFVIFIYALFRGSFIEAIAGGLLVAMGQIAVAFLFYHDVEDDD